MNGSDYTVWKNSRNHFYWTWSVTACLFLIHHCNVLVYKVLIPLFVKRRRGGGREDKGGRKKLCQQWKLCKLSSVTAEILPAHPARQGRGLHPARSNTLVPLFQMILEEIKSWPGHAAHHQDHAVSCEVASRVPVHQLICFHCVWLWVRNQPTSAKKKCPTTWQHWL